MVTLNGYRCRCGDLVNPMFRHCPRCGAPTWPEMSTHLFGLKGPIALMKDGVQVGIAYDVTITAAKVPPKK